MGETSDPEYWMSLHHHESMSSSSNDEPEVDEAGPVVNNPLQYGMFHVYLFMQGNFRRLRHLMQTDHAMQGRGYTILTWLLKLLKDYETNGITAQRVHHMQLLHGSISEMEQVVLQLVAVLLPFRTLAKGRFISSLLTTFKCSEEGLASVTPFRSWNVPKGSNGDLYPR